MRFLHASTWHREVEFQLTPSPATRFGGTPLEDKHPTIDEGDAAATLVSSPERFDAMLLDVDNGPAAFTASDDAGPYDDRGLAAARAALKIAGVLAVGSARVDRRFEQHLRLRRSRTGLAERRPCWPVRLKPDTTDE